MVVYFSDGFETGDLSKWTGSTSGNVQSVVKKLGTYALENEAEESAWTWITGETTVYVGTFLRFDDDMVNGWDLLAIQGTSTYQAHLQVYTNNRLKFYVWGNSTTYYGTTLLEKDTWYYVEIKLVLHDTTGSFEVRINGETEISQTGIDTKNDTLCRAFGLLGAAAGSSVKLYFDNFYIGDAWAPRYGIKIAKSGKSVTSEDPEDYHFWSKYRSKSVKYLGSLEVTTTTDVDSAPVTNTYTHDFGYIPQFMVFVTSYDGGYVNCDYLSGGTYGKDGDLWDELLEVYVTDTQIVVSANLYYFTPASGTWTGLAKTYTFDILLFMEEVETS